MANNVAAKLWDSQRHLQLFTKPPFDSLNLQLAGKSLHVLL